jgi:hypothetical protein
MMIARAITATLAEKATGDAVRTIGALSAKPMTEKTVDAARTAAIRKITVTTVENVTYMNASAVTNAAEQPKSMNPPVCFMLLTKPRRVRFETKNHD